MNRHERRRQKTLKEVTRENHEPITPENQALVAYVALVMADDMRKDGMEMFATVLEGAAGRLAMEHGRLPPNTYIPPDVYRTVWESVRASFISAAVEAAPTNGSA